MSIKVNWRKRPELSGKRERQSTRRKVGKSESRRMTMDTHTNAQGATKLQSTTSLPLSSFPLLCRFCYLPSCILAPWHMKPPWGGSERTKVQKPLGNFINNKLSDALMTWKYTYMTRQASHVQTASYMEAPQLWSCLPLTACLACLPCLPCAGPFKMRRFHCLPKGFVGKIHFSSFFSSLFLSLPFSLYFFTPFALCWF